MKDLSSSTASQKNQELSLDMIKQLYDIGVRNICVCAGARNSPFVRLLGEIKEAPSDLSIYNFFEERSAGFFSLGKAKSIQRPVAVITTSGTAVAELLPAVIEAYYSGIPLIVISADRPKNYRGSGAPQVIEQVGLFKNYCEKEFDLDVIENFHLNQWTQKKPIHLNVCFDEPLVDESEGVNLKEVSFMQKRDEKVGLKEVKKQCELLEFSKNKIKRFFSKNSCSLVIVSGDISNDQLLEEFLIRLNRPIYLEATVKFPVSMPMPVLVSNELKKLLITSGDKFLCNKFSNEFDSVIRIGSIPTVKLWRRLDNELSKIDILSFSELEFSGLARDKDSAIDVSSGLEFALTCLQSSGSVGSKTAASLALDKSYSEKLKCLFLKYKNSEPSFFYQLVKEINRQKDKVSSLYVGNSMPIRELDLAITDGFVQTNVLASRGANGIDGQLSTFFGSAGQGVNLGIFGDLTTMYDLSSPWVLKQLKNVICKVIIINNSGGQIFSQIFKSKEFINSHNIEFSNWAKMWNLDYSSVCDFSNLSEVLSERNNSSVIEVLPNLEQTKLFWQDYKQLWN